MRHRSKYQTKFPFRKKLCCIFFRKGILNDFIKTIVDNFGHVKVCGVVGNHGRVKDFSSKLNFDKEVYSRCKLYFQHLLDRKDSPLSWDTPEADSEGEFLVDKIDTYSCLLVHGNQWRSMKNIATIEKMITGYRILPSFENFDDVAFGYKHQTKFLM